MRNNFVERMFENSLDINIFFQNVCPYGKTPQISLVAIG